MELITINKDGILEFGKVGNCPPYYKTESIGEIEYRGILLDGVKGFCRYILEDDKIELRQIFIDEKERKKGYGSIIVNELIKIAKENNKKSIWLLSSTANIENTFGKFLAFNGFIQLDKFLWEKKI